MTRAFLLRAIKAAESDRDSCNSRVTDLTAFIRVLRECLEEMEEQTNPGTPTSKSSSGFSAVKPIFEEAKAKR